MVLNCHHKIEDLLDYTRKYRGSLKSSIGSIIQIYSLTQGEHKNTNNTLAIATLLSTTHVYQ
jgi:hypothetical protein